MTSFGVSNEKESLLNDVVFFFMRKLRQRCYTRVMWERSHIVEHTDNVLLMRMLIITVVVFAVVVKKVIE